MSVKGGGGLVSVKGGGRTGGCEGALDCEREGRGGGEGRAGRCKGVLNWLV